MPRITCSLLRPALLAAVLTLAAALPPASAAPPPAGGTRVPGAPVAPVRDVPQTWHGTLVHDPYRAMEDLQDPAVRAWLLAQGEAARRQLDAIPVRAALARRHAELDAAAGDSITRLVQMPGDRFYYLKRPANERQFKLMLRVGLRGPERVLVDPQVASARTGVPHAINHFAPSWDGRHVAYGLSAGGSEDAVLHVVEVATGREVVTPFRDVPTAGVAWLPDSRGVAFNQVRPRSDDAPPEDRMKDSRVLLWMLGTPAEAARPVFGPTVTAGLGLEPLDVAELVFSPDSRWVLARTSDTTLPEGRLFVAPVADLLEAGAGTRWRPLAVATDQLIQVALRGDHAFALSRAASVAGTGTREVLRIDLRERPDAGLAHAARLARAPEGQTLEGFALTRTALLLEVRDGASIGLRRVALPPAAGAPGASGTSGRPADGAPLRTPPGTAVRLGQESVAGDAVLLQLSGWTRPPRIMRLDAAGRLADTGWLRSAAPAGWERVVVENVEVPTPDGVRVPMTLLRLRDLARDGRRPTLLSGYGSYGLSDTARFDAGTLAWLERGGVIARANVRGGGARGDAWYAAGRKASKPATWRDGLACARWLLERGWTGPQRLAITGGSAGGIFAGRAITEAPELFAAAAIHVGLIDTVRAEFTANGATNVGEFGSVKVAADVPALLAMSTYHQVRDGVPYPAVLFTHGLNDPRVDAWHSAKGAARLQAASASGRPVLLRLDAQAGHGVGSTRDQWRSLRADTEAFLLWQMGLGDERSGTP